MKTLLNFGGFYETVHDMRVEDLASRDYRDEDTGEPYADFFQGADINWSAIKSIYAARYVDFVNEKVGCSLVYCAVVSPREYNFDTDKIECECDALSYRAVNAYIIKNALGDAVDVAVRYATTARSGYIPFFTFRGLVADRAAFFEVKMYVVLDHIADEFEAWYDVNCVYDTDVSQHVKYDDTGAQS